MWFQRKSTWYKTMISITFVIGCCIFPAFRMKQGRLWSKKSGPSLSLSVFQGLWIQEFLYSELFIKIKIFSLKGQWQLTKSVKTLRSTCSLLKDLGFIEFMSVKHAIRIGGSCWEQKNLRNSLMILQVLDSIIQW